MSNNKRIKRCNDTYEDHIKKWTIESLKHCTTKTFDQATWTKAFGHTIDDKYPKKWVYVYNMLVPYNDIQDFEQDIEIYKENETEHQVLEIPPADKFDEYLQHSVGIANSEDGCKCVKNCPYEEHDSEIDSD